MKLKSFFITKEIVTKLMKPPKEWGKNFANHTSDKGLIIRTYGELKKLKSLQIIDPMKK
jgi:hypothetical protein